MSLPIEWLPGESLYSIICRLHRLIGHSRSAPTSSLLFGSSRAGGTPAVTTSIDELVKRTRGMLGTVEELAISRQTSSYYLRFLPDIERSAVLNALRGSISPSKARAILRTRHPSNVLRWCPTCRTADLEVYGVTYWRLIHQLPCTWACLQHRCWLQEASVEGCSSWLSRWVLPDVFPQTRESLPADERVLYAAKVSAEIQAATSLQLPLELDDWFQSTPLPVKARHSIDSFYQALISGKVSEFAPTHRRKYLKADCDTLPLLMAVSSLSLESLHHLDRQEPKISRTSRNNETTQKVLKLARSGTSPSKAAKLSGVDTKTAQIWIGKALGLPPVRPKKLRGDVLETTLTLLRSGADKIVVAKAADLSHGTINTLLGIRPSLHIEWKQKQIDRRAEDARVRIKRLLEVGVGLSAKALRVLEPGAYAFLYRRDRLWLLEITSTLPSPAKLNGHKIIDAAVAKYLDTLQITPTSSESVHAADILLAIPTLAGELRYLLHMPQTIKSLQFLMRRLNSSQVELF